MIDWKPALSKVECREAVRIAEEITFALDALPRKNKIGAEHELALLHAYHHASNGRAEHLEKRDSYLEAAFETVASTPTLPLLFGGFVGVAWVVEHLSSSDQCDNDDLNLDVDDTILRHIDYVLQTNAPVHFDLIQGLVGWGVYFLERMPRGEARHGLEIVVNRLNAISISDPSGTAWWTSPEIVHEGRREQFPQGYYDLGVAHGIPGIIGFLARVLACGIAPETSGALLSGAIRWMFAHKDRDLTLVDSRSIIPSPEVVQTRGGWCYGDPGVAGVLMQVAATLSDDGLAEKAVALGRTAICRRAELSDAGLCHGATALSHILARLFNYTHCSDFATASRHWYHRALAFRGGNGIAGFATADHQPGRPIIYRTDPGLLSGAVGIALAFLALSTETEPNWDRLLLLSSPERVSA